MSRIERRTKKTFKVFCEGDTEFNYIDELRRQKRLSIALKMVNMKGGGYRSFLEQIKIDGTVNCLAKFIIIDGDRAVSDEGEKKNLRELLEYCILQNQSGRIPHVLIVDYPDFEYIACLHTPQYKGQNVAQYIVKEMGYNSIDQFKSDERVYQLLNSNGNSVEILLSRLKKENCFIVNRYSVNKTRYDITIKTVFDWEKLGRKGSNIDEFFGIIQSFDT